MTNVGVGRARNTNTVTIQTNMTTRFPRKTINYLGSPVTLTWIKLDNELDLNKYSPITQAYGVLFNSKGKILILDQTGDKKWTLPGGTVEEGESLVQTLKREVKEEANATITDIKLIGIQRVEDPQNKNTNQRLHYQSRFIAKISKLLPQVIDPAKNRIHEQKFVSPKEINNYIKWGITGKAIFADAVEKYFGK